MGGRTIANILNDKDVKLAGAVEISGHPSIGKDAGYISANKPCGVKISDSLEETLADADVVIDFSLPDATISNIETACKLKKAAVVGTTGHSQEQKKNITKMGRKLPMVLAPNMSIGVNVMWKALGVVASGFGSDIDISVSETHHVHKKDKPSGTALEIERVLKQSLGSSQNIKIESHREGEVVGVHTTIFDSPQETLKIIHSAKSRDAFAVGSIRAAKWVVGKQNGIYTMMDVLGL